MIELVLLITALVLLIFVGFIGFIWSIFSVVISGLRQYFYDIAISFDQTGNVICQYMGNDTMRKSTGHDFGNPTETISQVIGINRYHYDESKLKPTGTLLAKILDGIDDDHTRTAYNNWLNKCNE